MRCNRDSDFTDLASDIPKQVLHHNRYDGSVVGDWCHESELDH